MNPHSAGSRQAFWCPQCYMGAKLESLDPRDDGRQVQVVDVSFAPQRLHIENPATGRRTTISLRNAKLNWRVVGHA